MAHKWQLLILALAGLVLPVVAYAVYESIPEGAMWIAVLLLAVMAILAVVLVGRVKVRGNWFAFLIPLFVASIAVRLV